MKKRPIIVDVFAGVGGLSLGAARAGFRIAAAVELDSKALETHKTNFPKAIHLAKDVASLSGKQLLSDSGIKRNELDGLVGGPPCQGFSNIGRRDRGDPRNSLFVAFFRLVSETRPAFFIAENVPGVLDDRNKKTRERAREYLPGRYQILDPIIVRASDYGAPTIRTRVFFIGYDAERMNPLVESDFLPLANTRDVRVTSALKDLPNLYSTWSTEKDSWRSVGTLGDSPYERRIKGFVPADVGDPDALARFRSKKLVSGFLGTLHSKETIRRFEAVKPGDTEHISRYPRLDPKGYCPTLRAGTGPDRGSYQAARPIHPRSPRVICPREAARLQGFPDWFQFHPTKWHSFRQIGNSVSPIVSETILARLCAAISK